MAAQERPRHSQPDGCVYLGRYARPRPLRTCPALLAWSGRPGWGVRSAFRSVTAPTPLPGADGKACTEGASGACGAASGGVGATEAGRAGGGGGEVRGVVGTDAPPSSAATSAGRTLAG